MNQIAKMDMARLVGYCKVIGSYLRKWQTFGLERYSFSFLSGLRRVLFVLVRRLVDACQMWIRRFSVGIVSSQNARSLFFAPRADACWKVEYNEKFHDIDDLCTAPIADINHPIEDWKTTSTMKLQLLASVALALLSVVPGAISEVSIIATCDVI